MTKERQRAILVGRALKLVWESLESHIPYTLGRESKGETREFHKDCIEEYGELIHILSKLY